MSHLKILNFLVEQEKKVCVRICSLHLFPVLTLSFPYFFFTNKSKRLFVLLHVVLFSWSCKTLDCKEK